MIVGFFTFISPDLIYLPHARWRKLTCWKTSICLCIWLLSLPFPSCSSLFCIFLSLPSFSQLFSRPTLYFTSGCHANSVVQILLLSTCYLSPCVGVIISLAVVVSALQCCSWFNIVSGHLILNIYLRYLFCNMSSFILFYSVIFQVTVTTKWRTCPYITSTREMVERIKLDTSNRNAWLLIFLAWYRHFL